MAPIHIAIIPDGNRRWAAAQALKPWEGHGKAIENFGNVLEYCYNDPRVSALTLWSFSTENWQRDEREVAELMKLFVRYLEDQRPKFAEKGVHFLHSGRRDRIPAELKNLIEEVEAETKDHQNFTLHLAIDHGGKDEILRAISRIEGEVTEESLGKALDQPELPPVDLVIRSSGEIRTSGFMMWQTEYAEWIFWPKHFPEFSSEALEECLQEFEERTRRFGS